MERWWVKAKKGVLPIATAYVCSERKMKEKTEKKMNEKKKISVTWQERKNLDARRKK